MREFLNVFDVYKSRFALIRVLDIGKVCKIVDDGDVRYSAFVGLGNGNNEYVIDKRCQSSYEYMSDVFAGKSDNLLEVSVINTNEIIFVSKKDIIQITSSVDNDGVLVFFVHHRYVTSTEIRPTNKTSYEYIKSLFEVI